MKGTRHSEEHISAILVRQDWLPARYADSTGSRSRLITAGKPSTGGMESGDVKELRQLEETNRKLKHVLTELTLDNRALKDVIFGSANTLR